MTELRQRYDWLAQARGLPQARQSPHHHRSPQAGHATFAEENALKKWLRAGNTLLVVAGIFDTPQWGVPDFSTPTELYQLTGLSLDTHDDAEPDNGVAGNKEKLRHLRTNRRNRRPGRQPTPSCRSRSRSAAS